MYLNSYCFNTFLTKHFNFVQFTDVRCEYRNGLPVLLVPLPSRKEHCQFTLKPVTETVGDFLSHLKKEDGGIDTVSIYSEGKVSLSYMVVRVCGGEDWEGKRSRSCRN